MHVLVRAARVMLVIIAATGRAAEPPAATVHDGPVWSSADGITWRRKTEAAGWHPRLWFSTAVYRDRLWVAGGMRPPLSNEVWSLHAPAAREP